ncbi:hypothetical protein HDV00_004244 [Rhizophlyctis rosea]|nr:hypothetical protein HDV00_004244 [Rhizophlyctis rosea]
MSVPQNTSETTPLLRKRSTDDAPALATPLPKQIFALHTAVLADYIAGSLLHPFLYFMIQDFNLPPHPRDPSQIGWYVSLILCAYSLAQVTSSIPIGLLSDRWGRKTMLLLGLAGNVVCSVLLGLTSTFQQAVVVRVMLGLVNGNVGVAKSITGELTDSSNRARAFSLFGFWSSIGEIIGPILGGYLSNPADKYPEVFGSPFFHSYPYFLPCLAAAILGTTGFIATYVFLDETLQRAEVKVVRDLEAKSHSEEGEAMRGDVFVIPPQAWPPVVALGVLGLIASMNGEAFPLLANTPREDPNPGLGFGTRRLAIILCLQAVFKLVIQLLVYSKIHKHLQTLNTLRLGLLILLLTTVSTPALPSIPYTYLFPPLITLFFFQSAATSIAYTSIFILVIDSAPSTRWLGTINGLGQLGACTSRVIGPALLGWLWSWSRDVGGFPWVVWGVTGVFVVGLGVETVWIGRWRGREVGRG